MGLHFLGGICILALFFTASPLGFAQEKPFVYDDHGKRDPFLPMVSSSGEVVSHDSDLTVSDLTLQGVLADPQGNNLAIVNGKVVKPGDYVGAYEVESVDAGQVQLRKDQQQFILKLQKGGT